MAHPAIIAQRYFFGRLAPGGTIDAQLAASGVAGVRPDKVADNALWSNVNGTPRFYVLYKDLSPGSDLYTVGAIRQQVDPLYLVTVVGRVTDIGALGDAAARIDALLHDTEGAVAGGYVQACVREAPHKLGPLLLAGDVRQYELGGRYRLYLREG